MTLELRTEGDLFTENVDALVNPVNCVGVMGRGLAYQFRRRFPDNYAFYRRVCDNKNLMVGLVACFATGLVNGTGPRFIVNFPSKRHWRDDSQLEDIESTLGGLGYELQRLGIRSVAMPAVGCGLGGLAWRDVKPLIEFVADKTPDTRWIVFEPQED